MLRTLPRNWSAPCTTAPRRTQSSQFCAFYGNVEAVAEKRTGGDLRTGANIYGTRVCAYRVVFQKCLGSLSDLVMTQVVRDTPDRMGYTTPLEISTGAPKEDKDGNPFGLLTACSLSLSLSLPRKQCFCSDEMVADLWVQFREKSSYGIGLLVFLCKL